MGENFFYWDIVYQRNRMVDFVHKIQLPQRPPSIIPRPRLLNQLAAISKCRLLTITGPAGYGKTSLAIDLAAGTKLPVCWYSLDPSDADPRVFLEYLTAAIEQRFIGATKATRDLLAGGSQPSPGVIAASLTRDIYTLGGDCIIVIDDWHLIDHIEEINALVGQLISRCPNCHWLLISRTYPSIPNTMLLTARREMLSFDEQQLRFTPDEVFAVLQAEFQIGLSAEQATALTERFNGWITGVLLSVQASTWGATTQLGLGLPERQIYRFLVEQVLAHQPPELQSFLLDSALLEELTVPLCNRLLERIDAPAMLDQLLRRHLFISEVRPGVFLYHPLFREFLREHQRVVDPARYHQLMARMAHYHVDQEQWSHAFEMAFGAGDTALTCHILAVGGERLYTSGRVETLKHWFDLLASDQFSATLLCLKARVLLDLGHISEATMAVQKARLTSTPADHPQVAVLEAHLDRLAGRYEHALQTVDAVIDGNNAPDQRAAALRTRGICLHRLGQIDSAIQAFRDALALAQQIGNLYTMAQIRRDLGICHRSLGLLDEAEAYFDKADAYWASTGNTGHRAMSLNSKANIQHLKGQFTEAHASMIAALQNARTSGQRNYEAIILSCLGDLYSDLHLWERAGQMYSDARQIGGTAQLLADLDIAQVQLLVRQRKYDEAARALRQISGPARNARALPLLHYLGGCTACGQNDVQRAESALSSYVADGAEHTPTDTARAYVLKAHIAALRGDSAGLVEALERAVQIAAQIGSDTFLIVDLLSMRSVLHRAVAAGWMRGQEWLQRQQDVLLLARQIIQDDPRPLLVVRSLGREQILLNGELLTIGWAKAREVFYYLLAHPDGASSDTLREVIWPDLSVVRSREALRSAVYQLRSVLPRELIVLHHRQLYQIAREYVRLEYDVEAFLGLVEQNDSFEALFEAINLYQGSYLPSTDNTWPAAQRSHLERSYLRALMHMATHAERERNIDEALAFYQRVLAVDGLDEQVHARIMGCYIERGNRAAAIQQYHTLRRLLDEELGLEPGEQSEVEQLYRELLAV